MKRAIIFPGQGSQQVGMGKELAKNFASARAVFQEVDEALKQKLSEIMFEGDETELTLTENAQPAIMASSIAILRVLEAETGFTPETYAAYFAGHSLGEYTALAAAKSLTLADTARLLKLRGQAMQRAVPIGQGAMAAIIGLEFLKTDDVLDEANKVGLCVVANDNSKGQVVFSGEAEAVKKAAVIAKEMGAKMAVMLPVSAPFHSPLMQPAAEEMEVALRDVIFNTPTLSIVTNVTATAVSDANELRKLLVVQVTEQVRWRESVRYMAKQGVAETLEIGVGKVLTGLVKRIDKEIKATCIAGCDDIEILDRVA